MNEIKFWAIGGRYFICFFGSVTLPVDRIASIVFVTHQDKSGHAIVMHEDGRKWEFSSGSNEPENWRDKLLAFCIDEDK